MQHNTETKIWNATLYLRLSRDDGDKEESNSITGSGSCCVTYPNPPGASGIRRQDRRRLHGLNFEQPSFKKMLEDVKAGRTNCIIVKDLSRFGRNYLDAGEYIEDIPIFRRAVHRRQRQLRQSRRKKRFGRAYHPVQNLINEAYCRDISVKVRTQLEVKRKSGQYIGALPSTAI